MEACQNCSCFKSGSRSEITNYRPIAMLSPLSKVLESILYAQIYDVARNRISIHQHGFMPKRSTSSNLCNFTQFTSEGMDRNKQVDVIFTDLTKAFHLIHRDKLIDAMKELGVTGNILNVLSSYLHNRNQVVEHMGVQSRTYVASNGVPQGSNLGPLLFLIFFNSVCNELSNSFLLYADD